MNPTVTKLLGTLVSTVLALGAFMGIPGIEDPQMLAIVEKASAGVAFLLTGWLHMRQYWLLGERSKTQPVEHFDVRTSPKIVRGNFE